MTEAERERAAIVEWLRKEAKIWQRYSESSMAHAVNEAADAIQRLDHHKEDSHD